ncbi:MAG: NTP transferase domain-containing protein, partial [Desulfomonilaceae bacterium]
MMNYSAIVLAAGKGTRMKSNLCKVLHEIAGRPMISYVLESARNAGVGKICVVVGHQNERVREILKDQNLSFELQEPQLGTGHAVQSAQASFYGYEGQVLILCGDIPLVKSSTLKAMMDFHANIGSALTVMTAVVEDPYGYGRIIRSDEGLVANIIEERDADENNRRVREINAGVYLVDSKILFDLLSLIKPNNAQGEFYLTDIVSEANLRGVSVHAFQV